MKMLRRMTVLRGITAAHMPALQAKPQMYPGVSRFKALFTTLRLGRHGSNLIQVRTSFHRSFHPQDWDKYRWTNGRHGLGKEGG
jgi:hypothetical protein